MSIADPILAIAVTTTATLLATNFFISYLLFPIIATLLGGGALAVISTGVGRRREKTAAARDLKKSTNDMVLEIYNLLITQDPSPLNPNPTPGLVRRVELIDHRVETIEFTLTTNGFKHDTVLDNIQAIRHNTWPPGGESLPVKHEDGPHHER